jgi:hypothetical protein
MSNYRSGTIQNPCSNKCEVENAIKGNKDCTIYCKRLFDLNDEIFQEMKNRNIVISISRYKIDEYEKLCEEVKEKGINQVKPFIDELIKLSSHYHVYIGGKLVFDTHRGLEPTIQLGEIAYNHIKDRYEITYEKEID